jgi:hypothetical protein
MQAEEERERERDMHINDSVANAGNVQKFEGKTDGEQRGEGEGRDKEEHNRNGSAKVPPAS